MVELNIKILAPHVQCTTIYSCALQQEVNKKKKEYFIKPTIKIIFLSLSFFFPPSRCTDSLLTRYQACVILPLHVFGFYLQLCLFVCLFFFSLFFFSFFFVLRWFFMGIGYSGGVVAVLVVSMAVMVVVVVFQLLNEILFYCSVYIILLC